MQVRRIVWAMVTALTVGAATAAPLDPAVRAEGEASVARGLVWLGRQQREDGSWSNKSFPALTALGMLAHVRSGVPTTNAVVARARDAVLAHAQEDGGLYRKTTISLTGGLSTYNTAICLNALHALEDPALDATLLRARSFLAASQQVRDDARSGGFGYNQSGLLARPDLHNTVSALEAMRRTEDLEDRRPMGERRVDVRWDQALEFLGRLQNEPEAGADDAGGFFYDPADPKAGTIAQGDVVVFRSYGSMTYNGLLGLLYANVSREDPRVRSAFDWACRHWSLQENPGMGTKGLYFFYYVLGKSLAAFGAPELPLAGGPRVDWRAALIGELAARQVADGSWVNSENKRFMEGDPVLVTSYAILALQAALQSEPAGGAAR